MTTLGGLVGKSITVNLQNVDAATMALMAGMPLADFLAASLSAMPGIGYLGTPQQITASLAAWTQQDDDAHEPCSLTACRSPLHPGPCKGWKGLLHSVSPGTYKTLEDERVAKANTRRVKRIADLHAQGKPIPRRLLTEIKPKPAPVHPAQHAQAVPLGQVNQKADLAGGQAHHAGAAVSKAAGVQVKTAPPLPLGPKAKKPTVAGRGPAFVITQPKVTDTYKLDKADKITPQEWAALSDHDKTTIRNELTAIKARGFGPQQTKADALLLKLYAPNVANTAPGGTVTAPALKPIPVLNPIPGKVSLGQAAKTAPVKAKTATTHTVTPLGAEALLKQHGSADITYATGTRYEKTYTDVGLQGRGDHQHYLVNKGAGDRYIVDKDGKDLQHLPKQSGIAVAVGATKAPAAPAGVPGAPSKSTPAAPASPSGIKPSAPQAPGTPAHMQHAKAVADRTAPKAVQSKTQVDAYDKLTKADFDALPADTQKTVRDDLANAKAKFLDPKKQQAAQHLLDRFGSSHPTPSSPAAPGGAKGYSDPMNEAVKATSSGTVGTDDVLKAVGRLTPAQVGQLDDADRKSVLHRLMFVATHPKATAEQKAKATAFGRIINGRSHVPAGQKLDHAPSLAEIHAEEQKGGHAAVADALEAAQQASLPRDARVKALTALTKPQFDGLPSGDQRKITDVLQALHYERDKVTGNSTLDPAAAAALTALTGKHPAMHRLEQAEADYRAGEITGDQLHTEFLHARVQAPGTTDKGAQKAVVDLAARIARDNPTLPTYVRVRMVGDQKYGNPAYDAIAMAGMKHNWDPAPRLSQYDMANLFAATDADLAKTDPIHAEAVKSLREHIITTGLAPNSPWTPGTKGSLVDALLNTNRDGEIPPERLAMVNGLSTPASSRVETVLRRRLADQTNDHAKTQTWIALRALQGEKPLTPTVRLAVLDAADRFPLPDSLDHFRRLEPADFQGLPNYVQAAIGAHLDHFQEKAERSGPILTWGGQDDPFKVMPGTLKDHLEGMRTSYSDRRDRAASDIANFGQKIINPYDRTRVYGEVGVAQFRAMTQGDQDLINADLDRIAADTSFNTRLRYQAKFTKDFLLNKPTGFTVEQIVAVGVVNPDNPQSNIVVENTLGDLDKSDFDKLDRVYRDAIDARVKTLLPLSQQFYEAKFHPAAPQTATPAGLTPTTVQTNVPPHVQEALDTIYGVHASGKSHTMAHQLSTYGALRGSDFAQLNAQEQGHLLGDLSFIATTAKGPSADKAKKLIDRFSPAGTPAGHVPTGAAIPPANAVPGQQRFATPLKGLAKSANPGKSGDKWISLPGGGRVWGEHGASGLLIKHTDPATGEERYLMVQRGPAISDPGKWTFPGGASESKETPHEGATRETIEELGLKDDQFKDALVHGDHTFTVPNHPWKYTSVAITVPQQFKPNLSTAHARAETSDAKWMTLAEIQALDKAGTLHHPIAGGKLEQNVISLYPQPGTGQTLGQVVRPGPVSKRQGRLSVPSGGRQAPATFNAWTAPHKPSKGKDLIPDKATVDAQRQKIKQDRKLYDGKTADGRLAAIGAQQGFDDTPTVVDKKEIDRLLATGDYIEVWRGVSGAGGRNWRSGNAGGKTAAQINEEMRTGPAYYGKGIFGNGYYLATQRSVATQYADSTKGSVARMLIPKSAVTQKYDKVKVEAFKNPRLSKAKGSSSYEDSTFYDPGRYAAAKGLDGIEIEPHHISPGGGARHVAAPGKPAFNWLNRSVLIVQKEPG